MKWLLSVGALAFSLSLWAEAPVVDSVGMSWDAASSEATITYTLSGAPAVVTLDIIDGQGKSIGGGYIGAAVEGDVFRRVETKDSYKIAWRPSTGSFQLPPDGVRAVVTAYPVDDTPDYMVVSLAKNAADANDLVRYYPGEDFLPGGLHQNREYKSTKIVMRKIVAKDVAWNMGSTEVEESKFNDWTLPADEASHPVMLTNIYYMAVFETTHGQHYCMTTGKRPADDGGNFLVSWTDRPVEQEYYYHLRGATQWPEAPTASTPLGLLRARTGIDFDLPSEAQWEYACRAGHGEGVWGNGVQYAARKAYLTEYRADGTFISGGKNYWWSGAVMPGRGMTMGAHIADGDKFTRVSPESADVTRGTAVVGSYAPNSWGLYDMHGNVFELTLDYYMEDISALNGGVCCDSASGLRVIRGGGIYSRGVIDCRCAARKSQTYKGSSSDMYVYDRGYRLCCRNGLK